MGIQRRSAIVARATWGSLSNSVSARLHPVWSPPLNSPPKKWPPQEYQFFQGLLFVLFRVDETIRKLRNNSSTVTLQWV